MMRSIAHRAPPVNLPHAARSRGTQVNRAVHASRLLPPQVNLRAPEALRMNGLSLPTVWSEFSPLAVEHGAVNLGQGFPDWAAPRFAKDCIQTAVEEDFNQYARPWGHQNLCNALAEHYSPSFGRELDPQRNITTSNGCCEGLHMAFLATLDPDDEVILMDPAMDIYAAQVQLAGGKPVRVPLRYRPPTAGTCAEATSASWVLDLGELEAQLMQCSAPRVLVLNTPHNPTGKMFSRSELEALADLVQRYHLIVFSDEVYETLYFDEEEHVRFASLPKMWERTLTFSSAAKTFSVTGWKCGWVIGPDNLIANVASVGQWSHFCVSSPTQEAVARMLSEAKKPYLGCGNYYDWMRNDYGRKRLLLQHALASVGMRPIMPQGGFFILADTSVADVPEHYMKTPTLACPAMTRDWAFCRWLTEEVKVTAIPPSSFCSRENAAMVANMARFAFCKDDDSLLEAHRRLNACLGCEVAFTDYGVARAAVEDSPAVCFGVPWAGNEDDGWVRWEGEHDEPGPPDAIEKSGDVIPDPSIYGRPKQSFYTFGSGQLDFRSRYRLLCSAIVPRPIAWVSTISLDGVNNLAPMSFFMPVASNPATIAWSQTVRKDGTEKDTLLNIRATGEFVVNHVSASTFQQMYVSSHGFPPDVDEFAMSGLTPIASFNVRPCRILEAPVQMECKLVNFVRVGDGKYGSSTIIIGEIVRWHVQEQSLNVVDGRVNLDPESLNTISRLGGLSYMQLNPPRTFDESGDTWNESHW